MYIVLIYTSILDIYSFLAACLQGSCKPSIVESSASQVHRRLERQLGLLSSRRERAPGAIHSYRLQAILVYSRETSGHG